MLYLCSYFYTDSPPRIVRLSSRRSLRCFPLSFLKEREERPPCGRWGEYKKTTINCSGYLNLKKEAVRKVKIGQPLLSEAISLLLSSARRNGTRTF